MKRYSILSLMLAGFFVFTLAGVALADMDRSERPVESLQNNQTGNETSFYAPGSWQYEGAVEAGSLPMSETLSKGQPSGNSEGFTVHEYGGIPFREEIDSGGGGD